MNSLWFKSEQHLVFLQQVSELPCSQPQHPPAPTGNGDFHPLNPPWTCSGGTTSSSCGQNRQKGGWSRSQSSARTRAPLALGCCARAESFPKPLWVWSWGWGTAGQGMLPLCLLAHRGVFRSRVRSIPHIQGHQVGFGVFILGCSSPKGGLGHIFLPCSVVAPR